MSVRKNHSKSSKQSYKQNIDVPNEKKLLQDGSFQTGFPKWEPTGEFAWMRCYSTQFTPKLIELLKNSSSASSRKALISDFTLFLKWSSSHGIKEPLPSTPEYIAEWIAFLSDIRSIASITRYVSSISRIHERAGWPNPTKSEIVYSALKGLKRSSMTPQRKAHALRGEDLLRILDKMSHTEWNSRRNRAILSIGWACALRSSEICRLDLSDIVPKREGSQEGLIVNIRRSKTDQQGSGHKIGIPHSPLSVIISEWVCDAKSLYGSDDGPMFPRLGYAQRDRWFPRVGSRDRLSTRGLQKIIMKILDDAGLTGSVHSLRRGLITDAAEAGVPDRVIQRHSRHKSLTVLRGYVEDGNIMTDNPLPAVFHRLFGQ